MGEFLGKSKLDSLNTIINYAYFDKYTKYCDNYPNITAAKSKLKNFPWINNISDNLLNALCYVYMKKENKTINKNLCNYLYYWLGSKVLTNLRLKNFFFEVVLTSYRILNESRLGNVCDPVNYMINDYNFQKFKDIYDLSENYNTFKSHFININPSCDKDYQNELNSYLFLYKELRNECNVEKTNHNEQYCKAFNDYFNDDKNTEIFSWTCQLRETEEQVQLIEGDDWENAGNVEIPERPVVGGLQVHGDWGETAQNSRSIVSYLNKEGLDEESILSVSEDSSPSTIKKSITSAVSAAGVLVPPFLIYNVITIVIVQQDVLFYI